MELSEYCKGLIEDWLLFTAPPAFEARYYGTAPAILQIREDIYQKGIEDEEDAKKADIQLIKCVLQNKAYPPDSDDPEQCPLAHWWWHLDKIAEKTYDADLLSEHVREIYLNALKGGLEVKDI